MQITKKKLIQICCISASLLLYANSSNAQVSIGVPASDIHPSAQLDVSSTSKGLLLPRMTEVQRNAIASPAAGLWIWCNNCGTNGEMQIYNGSSWTNGIGAQPAQDLTPRVTIGTQIWTTKNLDVATYRDGTPIPKITTNTDWTAMTTGAWCWFNNDSATYAATYGRLYNWYAVAGIWNEASKTDVSQRKQLASAGYHIPSDPEWTTLENYLGGASVASGKMKEEGTSHWLTPNIGASNSSGFSARSGGLRGNNGSYESFGIGVCFWSSTSLSSNVAKHRLLVYSNGNLYTVNNNKNNGFSVRCLRD